MTEGPGWGPTFERVKQVPGRPAAAGKQRLTEKDVADKWAYLNRRNAASIAVSMGTVDTGDDFDPYEALADIAQKNADAANLIDAVAKAIHNGYNGSGGDGTAAQVQTVLDAIATALAAASVRVAVPANASAPGLEGHWATDSTHLYICTATDTWLRAEVPFATW